MIPPASFFSLQIALVVQGLLQLHTHFGTTYSGSVRNTIGILVGIASNPDLASDSGDIFITLILSIHEHECLSICLCLCSFFHQRFVIFGVQGFQFLG